MGDRTLRHWLIGVPLALVLLLAVIGPLVTVVLWAFAERWRYPALLPNEWGLRFWPVTLGRPDVQGALPTSLALATTVTLLAAAICLPAAYAFARMRFPGREALLLSFVATQAFPRFALYVMVAVIFLSLGLVGTFQGVVLIQLVSALLYMIWIPTAAFRGIDRRLEEAALDVGASPRQVFLHVTLPQAAPAIGAALLLTFVNTFYETEGALLIGVPTVRTMPVVMISLVTEQLVVQYGAVLSVLLWVPSLVLLVIARRVLDTRTLAAGLGV